MKKLFYILILLFSIILCLALAGQIDDDVSEDSIKLIERLETNAKSEAYIYINGIFAAENEKPATVGKKILDEQIKLSINTAYEPIEYPDSKKLPLPAGNEFCNLWGDVNCLAYIFSSNVDSSELLVKHRLLVDRSNEFLDFNEYQTMVKPTIDAIIPPYQYIAAAERLKVLDAISIYKNGDTSRSINSLLTQFVKLRKAMELQDNLIGKLVLLMKLSEIVDVLSIIASNENISLEPIPRLTKSEKSFHIIAAREFGMSYYMFKSLDKNPEFFEYHGSSPGWAIRILFKPNMTINAATPIYYQVEKTSHLSHSEFVAKIKSETSTNIPTLQLRNFIGHKLILFIPDFNDYIARFLDFDVKLSLFNQLHNLKLQPKEMKNPYYGKEEPENLDNKLCFKGPIKDEKHLRCLRVKI